MLLAIDTSTSAVTASLHDGEKVVAHTSTVDSRRHTEILAPAIEWILTQAGIAPAALSRVVVGVGPGPFTGLRVGIMTAMTFAYALDLRVGGVCSLDALAHRAQKEGFRGPLLVATDARRKEVYWARYDLDGGPIAAGDPAVDKAAVVAERLGRVPGVGRGANLYADVLDDVTDGRESLLDVDAADLAEVAFARAMAGERLLPTEPLYLRRPDAAPVAVAPQLARAGPMARGSSSTTTRAVDRATTDAAPGETTHEESAPSGLRPEGTAPIVLRDATWRDIAALTRLDAELFEHEAWNEQMWWEEFAARPRRQYAVAEPADALARNAVDAVAENDDTVTILGYAGLNVAGTAADVITIAVAPEARGRGLGRRLLDHLVTAATHAGAEALLLEVRTDNTAAIGLYETSGFERLSVRRRYYQPGDVDAVIMRKLLKETR